MYTNCVKSLFYNSFIKMQNKNCVNVCICHKFFLLKFYTVSSQKLLCCGMPMQWPAVHIVGKDNGTTNTWSHKKHICQRHLDIILMYRVLSRVLAFLVFFSCFLFFCNSTLMGHSHYWLVTCAAKKMNFLCSLVQYQLIGFKHRGTNWKHGILNSFRNDEPACVQMSSKVISQVISTYQIHQDRICKGVPE